MEKIKVIGGTPLHGEIEIKGAKNAVLPLMACALLTNDKVILNNIPHLADILTMIQVLEHLGAKIEFKEDVLTIQANNIHCFDAPYELVSKMRASFWVLGPLLGRFHQAKISLPGGCAIGTRGVDRHLYAMERLGAKIDIQSGYVLASTPKELQGNDIVFQPTVGGTMNALMAGCLAKGTTRIINAAKEPEVTDLALCLNQMGAKITGIGTSELIIQGVTSLHGTTYTVVSDRIEAITYAVAAGITHGELLIKKTPLYLIESVAETLQQMGLKITAHNNGLLVSGKDVSLTATNITTEEFPGFPTDCQAQVMALMCLAKGTSIVTENIFESRFMHVQELVRMGANIQLRGSRTAIVNGVEVLSGAHVMASDLRASAALVLAGLAGQGETHIHRIYHLDRGYDKLDEKLRLVGANIERLPDTDL